MYFFHFHLHARLLLSNACPHHSDSNKSKEAPLPDFHRLVNFPDLLIKGRNGSSDTSSGDSGCSSALNGKKRCVMCGKLRVSATYVRVKKNGADNDAPGDDPDAPPDSNKSESSAHIIPRQNKGVCTACDVTVWIAIELDLEIKWCKGCKNFRPWAAFGNKGTATKCVRCRDRQKEKYAMQKNVNRHRKSDGGAQEKDTAEDAQQPCHLALVAADGLRNLMHSV